MDTSTAQAPVGNADAAASATAASVAAADLEADGRLVADEVSEVSR